MGSDEGEIDAEVVALLEDGFSALSLALALLQKRGPCPRISNSRNRRKSLVKLTLIKGGKNADDITHRR